MPNQGCGIQIEWFQVMPHPSYAEVTMETTCGTYQTDGYGRQEIRLCTPCTRQYQAQYPQGWETYPGDRCPHGAHVGGIAEDYMCHLCESGEG